MLTHFQVLGHFPAGLIHQKSQYINYSLENYLEDSLRIEFQTNFFVAEGCYSESKKTNREAEQLNDAAVNFFRKLAECEPRQMGLTQKGFTPYLNFVPLNFD